MPSLSILISIGIPFHPPFCDQRYHHVASNRYCHTARISRLEGGEKGKGEKKRQKGAETQIETAVIFGWSSTCAIPFGMFG